MRRKTPHTQNTRKTSATKCAHLLPNSCHTAPTPPHPTSTSRPSQYDAQGSNQQLQIGTTPHTTQLHASHLPPNPRTYTLINATQHQHRHHQHHRTPPVTIMHKKRTD